MSPIIEAMKPSPNSDRQSCASSGELFPKNGTAFATESPTTFVSSRPTIFGSSRRPGVALRKMIEHFLEAVGIFAAQHRGGTKQPPNFWWYHECVLLHCRLLHTTSDANRDTRGRRRRTGNIVKLDMVPCDERDND